MKDFDKDREFLEEKDRTFRWCGETFVVRVSVPQETFNSWWQINPDWTREQVLAKRDEMVLSCLEPGQDDRWQTAKSADPPMNEADHAELILWLFQQCAGRPTVARSGSSNGRATTTPISTEDSPSLAST